MKPAAKKTLEAKVSAKVAANGHNKTAKVKQSAKTSKKKFIYFFGAGKAEGDAKMKELLGGKGANLAEMTNIGLPVPPGFTITTEVCTYFYENNRTYPKGLFEKELPEALAKVEKLVGKKIWRCQKPLAGLRALWCQSLHAGHDGYHSQLGLK